jgi:hypothetical protein
MRVLLLIIAIFPAALGFAVGAGPRGLLILAALGLALAVVYGFIFGLCRVAGDTDDQAGYPRE